jgi:hypothetical protein
MSTSADPSNHPAPAAAEPASAVTAVDWIMFALRAARRHPLLGAIVGTVAALIGCVVVSAVPSLYDSTTKIYASRHAIMTQELASGRRVEDTTRFGLSEAVMNYQNLASLAHEAKLADRWDTTRTWPLALKDKLFDRMFGSMSRADRERALSALLEGALQVATEDTGSIRFRVQWRDPESAYTLVTLAQRNYLQTRQAEELAAFNRASALLEDEVKRADEAVEPAVKELQELYLKHRNDARPTEASETGDAAARPRVSAAATGANGALPTPTAAKRPAEITAKLEEVRRAQREVLEPWQRRNAELRFQLAELRAIYGPEHPQVRQQEAKLRSATEPPPELSSLKESEQQLMASLASVGLDDATPARRSVGSSRPATERSSNKNNSEDPEVSAARLRLEGILRQAQEIRQRLDSIRMDMATAQAGFKYRYSVVEPAQVPSRPIKPNRPRLYATALGIALLLGLLAGAARELLTGRVQESWQLRSLGLETLAEIDLDDWRPRRS